MWVQVFGINSWQRCWRREPAMHGIHSSHVYWKLIATLFPSLRVFSLLLFLFNWGFAKAYGQRCGPSKRIINGVQSTHILWSNRQTDSCDVRINGCVCHCSCARRINPSLIAISIANASSNGDIMFWLVGHNRWVRCARVFVRPHWVAFDARSFAVVCPERIELPHAIANYSPNNQIVYAPLN